jgi:hypothetical protein
VTFPLPVPVAPVRIVIHPALSVAVQVQPDAVDTEMGVALSPAALMETFVGVTE